MDTIYSKSPDFVQREVAGECILIPIRRQLTNVNSMYVLNETGALAWKRLDGKRSMREIVADIALEFDVTAERLEQDVTVFVEDLLSIHAIHEEPS